MNSKWSRYSLRDLIEIQHGFAFKGEYFCDDPEADRLITPGNFRIGGGFQHGPRKCYRGPVPEEFVLRAGDLVVTMTDLSKNSDTLGYPAIIPATDCHRYLHNQRVGKVTLTEGDSIDKRFLYFVMCSQPYRQEILASATGTAVKHTAPQRILAFDTLLPPIAEQRAIACILGSLDDKIELNRRLNHTLEQMARAIFKSWFVDFDPVMAKSEGRKPV
ncbi:MAG TPA: restriction endonuclease subunit S [Armatimonadota bacterium]|nr:restriction endonuclease subunit S [Armatimonadota bacterium]